MRFRFELPRPLDLDLCLLGSRGALVEESRSTRLDFGVLFPDDPLRDRERELDEDRLFDFDELERFLFLLLDPDFRWGILPSLLDETVPSAYHGTPCSNPCCCG